MIPLDVSSAVWKHFFTVAPLVVVGSKEGEGYDMAPKHLAFPLSFENYFGFVCTPEHRTYQNIKEHKEFSVSFPLPDQLIITSLTASPRSSEMSKSDSIISALPTVKTKNIDALLLTDSYLHLECKLFKIIDGFAENSLITGTICAASVHEDYMRLSEQDEGEQIKKHPLLAYVADGRYSVIEDTFNFPYPKDFTR